LYISIEKYTSISIKEHSTFQK